MSVTHVPRPLPTLPQRAVARMTSSARAVPHPPTAVPHRLRPVREDAARGEHVRDGTSGRALVTSGRALLVGLCVYAFIVRSGASAVQFLLATAALSGAWLWTLSMSLRAFPYSLGPSAPCAAGSVGGLVVAGFANPWLPGMQLGAAEIAAMGGAVFAFTWAWELAVRRARVAMTRVLVVGPPELATKIAEQIAASPASPFELLGAVSRRPHRHNGHEHLLGGMPSLRRIVESQRPDLLVLADPKVYAPTLDRLLDIPDRRPSVISYASFFEHAFGRVPVKDLSSAWFMAVLHFRRHGYSGLAERSFDVIVGLSAGVLALPLLLPIAALVRLSGPVFHRQIRVGEHGRPFGMLKFRTMIEAAEADGVARWASADDVRITRVGRVLRRTHLDEIPQLWNVLRGEMSIVGPRPERPEFLDVIAREVPHWSRRLMVKPGVTGWAQVRSGYAADLAGAADKLSYDLWYLRNRTLLIDVAVCGKTFGRLFFDSRAH